jgi:GTP cyclohydrolase II
MTAMDKVADARISSTVLMTHFGEFEFYVFSWSEHEEDNVLVLAKFPLGDPVLVRVQSACYTAEIFRSLDCDCHEQLEMGLRRISEEGGLFIYMLQDGRGAGLYLKVLGLELGRTKGLDTADAYAELGIEPDPRSYDRVRFVLHHFKVSTVRLLTNNPRKIGGLSQEGITVQRESAEIAATLHSRAYLAAKKEKLGHLLRLNGQN